MLEIAFEPARVQNVFMVGGRPTFAESVKFYDVHKGPPPMKNHGYAPDQSEPCHGGFAVFRSKLC